MCLIGCMRHIPSLHWHTHTHTGHVGYLYVGGTPQVGRAVQIVLRGMELEGRRAALVGDGYTGHAGFGGEW